MSEPDQNKEDVLMEGKSGVECQSPSRVKGETGELLPGIVSPSLRRARWAPTKWGGSPPQGVRESAAHGSHL